MKNNSPALQGSVRIVESGELLSPSLFKCRIPAFGIVLPKSYKNLCEILLPSLSSSITLYITKNNSIYTKFPLLSKGGSHKPILAKRIVRKIFRSQHYTWGGIATRVDSFVGRRRIEEESSKVFFSFL